MNQKKRIFRILPLFLLATLLFTLAACGSQGGDTSAAPVTAVCITCASLTLPPSARLPCT